MKADADICVRSAAGVGLKLDYTEETLSALVELVGDLTPWRGCSESSRDGLVRLLGGYFGELLRRKLNGGWVWDSELACPAVVFKDGVRAYPHAALAKRWRQSKASEIPLVFRGIAERLDRTT